MINVLSLFDGIGVAGGALARAGIGVAGYWASEIDPKAAQVASQQVAQYRRVGDVSGVTPGAVPSIDLMIGGSPCTSLSVANSKIKDGLRHGESVLFWEFVRLLRAVRPRYFVLENVASMPAAARDEMSRALFGVQPVMINSALVSAQWRRRYYWVGARTNTGYTTVPVGQPRDRGVALADILEPSVADKYFVNSDLYIIYDKPQTPSLFGGTTGGTIRIGHKARYRDGTPIPEYKLRASGRDDEQVISPSGKAGTLLASGGTGGQPGGVVRTGMPRQDRVYSPRGKSVTLCANAFGDARLGLYHTKRGKQNEMVFSDAGKACAVTTTGAGAGTLLAHAGGIRRLTPTECERLQTLPDGYTAGYSDSARYKMLGNAFTADVIVHILRALSL